MPDESSLPADALIRRFHEFAGYADDVVRDADSLIGVFQSFRPDGRRMTGLFEGLPQAQALESRLARLFEAAGDDRRPQGGRDAYFVIRNPPPLPPDHAEALGVRWLEGIAALARVVGDQPTADRFDPVPTIRVLEGIPPKHPKLDHEKSALLKSLQADVPLLVQRLETGSEADTLRPAFYFTACDTMLRDYLMWPLYASSSGLEDPLEPYFQLWRHGVKYRTFSDNQIDLYLPRHPG